MRNSALEKAAVKKVKSEVDILIDNVRSQLQLYVEDEKDVESLQEVTNSLTLIERTLQLVQINGASVLAREMAEVVNGLLNDSIAQKEKAQEALSRGILQMSDYLGYVQAGHKDVPIVLLPLLNDLRGVREAPLLSENILFFPNLDDIDVPNVHVEFGISAQEYAKKIRYGYQSGLVGILQNKEIEIAATKICKVAIRMHQCSKEPGSQRLWWITSAVAQALAINALSTSAGLASLLGQVDRQMKKFAEQDEFEFAKNISLSLVKNLLYYVGIAEDRGKIVTNVKSTYGLNELIPNKLDIDQMCEGISGLNVDVMQAVSKALHEDIANVKDAIELYVHNENRSSESVSKVGQDLHKIADTLSMIGLDEPREEVIRGAVNLQGLSADELEHADENFVKIAETLINAENIVDNFINYRLLNKPIIRSVNQSGENEIESEVEVENNHLRKIQIQTVSEILAELEEAKNAVSHVLSSPEDKSKHQEVLSRFHTIIGALSVLNFNDVNVILENIQTYLTNDNAAEELSGQPAKLDAFADSVTSIECYLEAVIADDEDPGDILRYGAESLSRLMGTELVHADQVSAIETIEVDDFIEQDNELLELEDTSNVGKKNTEISSNSELEDLSATSLDLSIDPELFKEISLEQPPSNSQSKTDVIVESEEATELETVSDPSKFTTKSHIDSQLLESNNVKLDILESDSENKDKTSDASDTDELEGVVDALLETSNSESNSDSNQELVTNEKDLNVTGEGLSTDLPSLLNDDNHVCQADEAEERDLLLPKIQESEFEIDHEVQQESYADIENLEISESVELSSAELPSLTDHENKDNQFEEHNALDLPQASKARDGNSEYTINLQEDGLDKQLHALQQDADEEVVLIFIEEAEEEIEKIFKNLEPWKSDIHNEEALVTIRRSFHTLKGSGRLVGAEIIAEFSWQFEKILNKVIESTFEICESLFEILDKSAIGLQQLLTQLKSGQNPEIDIQALIYEAQNYPVNTDNNDENLEKNTTKTSDLDIETQDEEIAEEIKSEDVLQNESLCVDAVENDNLESKKEFNTELREIFIQEAFQHIETLEESLNAGYDKRKLKVNENILHALHTLYGSSRIADVPAIANICGLLENYCQACSKQNQEIIGHNFNVLAESVQYFKHLITDHSEDLQKIYIDEELQNKVNDLKYVEVPVLEDFVGVSESNESNDFIKTQSVTAENVNIVDEVSVENADLYGDKDADLVDIFFEEAGDILATCNDCLSKWRNKSDDTDSVSELRRQLHTLKGSARMAAYSNIGDFSHAVESLVISIAEGNLETTDASLNLLQRCLDALYEMIDEAISQRPVYPATDLIDELNNFRGGQAPLVDTDAISDQAFAAPVSRNSVDKSAMISPSSSKTKVSILKPIVSKEKQKNIQPVVTPQQAVRLQAETLDDLVNNASEVNIFQARLEQVGSKYIANINELEQVVDRLREQLRNLEIETETQILSRHAHEIPNVEDFDPLELDRYSNIQQLSRSLAESVNDLLSIKDILYDQVRDSEMLLLQQRRISSDLQEGLMHTRTLQFNQLIPRMQRIVRQTASELDKDVDLKVKGADTEVDSSILNRIVAPIEHLIRNAISHGIEEKDERKKTDKPPTGVISIDVSREGTEIIIEITDDGQGIDTNKVKSKAQELGLIEKTDISEQEALNLIMTPGFSTANEVTQVSGRGVGMDVVANELKQLGGFLQISSVLGEGANFTIRIPFTLAIAQALLIKSGEETYAVPLASVEGVVRLSAYELKQKYEKNNATYQYAEKDYRLCHLGALLGISQPQLDGADNMLPVLLVRSGDSRLAIQIEATLGNREVVVKPLASQLSRLPAVSGATILGDGSVVLILDIQGLIRLDSVKQLSNEVISEKEPSKNINPTVLVVDDSITIRKVTTRFLERNNYKVVTAKDGVDAVQALQDFTPDMILLDIEMPRMDGYELATHVRNNERLKDIPIIMITSRTGEKHRRRALDIGVQEYLGKPYNESELLRNIETVLH